MPRAVNPTSGEQCATVYDKQQQVQEHSSSLDLFNSYSYYLNSIMGTTVSAKSILLNMPSMPCPSKVLSKIVSLTDLKTHRKELLGLATHIWEWGFPWIWHGTCFLSAAKPLAIHQLLTTQVKTWKRQIQALRPNYCVHTEVLVPGGNNQVVHTCPSVQGSPWTPGLSDKEQHCWQISLLPERPWWKLLSRKCLLLGFFC